MGIRELYDAILDDEELAVAEVARYKAAGGGTICDPTNIGLARDPAALKRISERTGVNVVMGAGWYRERVYPDYIQEELPDQLAERLVAEIVNSVNGSGVRPGFIGEIGTERHHVTPAQERVFRAAGRAHVRTGIPIMTHTTHWGELALEQIDLLGEEGVDPSRVIISTSATGPASATGCRSPSAAPGSTSTTSPSSAATPRCRCAPTTSPGCAPRDWSARSCCRTTSASWVSSPSTTAAATTT